MNPEGKFSKKNTVSRKLKRYNHFRKA